MEYSNYDRIFKFKNGYGASVVRNEFTYGGKNGLYELVLLTFHPGGYSTYIDGTEIGHLTPRQVALKLREISKMSDRADTFSI